MLVKVTKTQIVVTDAFEHRDVLKRCGFKWRGGSASWVISKSPDAIARVFNTFGKESDFRASQASIDYYDEAAKCYEDHKKQSEDIRRIKESWVTDNPVIDYDESVVPAGAELYEHQKKALTLLNKTSAFGVFLKCGWGKTPTVILDFASKMAQNKISRVLVVCTKTLMMSSWPGELQRWAPQLTFRTLHYGKDDNIRMLRGTYCQNHPRAPKDFDKPADVYIINYESFPQIVAEIAQAGIDTCVLDESSKLKNPISKVTKACLKVRKQFRQKYVLSGTPAPNNPLEYFPQIAFLSDVPFGSNYYQFRSTYFEPSGFMGYDWRMKPDVSLMKTFKQKIGDMSVTFTEGLDLPEKFFQYVDVPGDKAFDRVFTKAHKEAVLELGDEPIALDNPLAKTMKCRKICDGFVSHQDSEETYSNSFKLDALKDKLEEIGDEQVIIWSCFRPSLLAIAEALGEKAVSAHSLVKNVDESLEKFKSGKAQYLVAHPKSIGHGHTLTNAAYVVFFSVDYSGEDWEQAIKRVDRISQTRPVIYYMLRMTTSDGKKTNDHICYRAARGKIESADALLAEFMELST